MALDNYRLLIGRASKIAFDDDASPHIEILIEAEAEKHRIAVNVRSQLQPHALLYARLDPWDVSMTQHLVELPVGVHDLRADHPELRLDYVRDGWLQRDDMSVAPYRVEGPDNDLREFLVPLLEQAIDDPAIRIYAFGEAWGPEHGKPDKYFGFEPGRGMHDIHMNQGSSGRFRKTNGTHQDGALAVFSPGENRWIGIFLAFQSQSWKTDDQGHPTEIPSHKPTWTLDTNVGIIAALVNPVNPEEGRETVTLFNCSDGIVDLDGWTLQDGKNRSESLEGLAMGPGETYRVHLTGNGVRLGNKGASLRLVDSGGAVVHQVEYAKGDLGPEGWSLLF